MLVLGLGLKESLRTIFVSLALALTLKLKSLALALALQQVLVIVLECHDAGESLYYARIQAAASFVPAHFLYTSHFGSS